MANPLAILISAKLNTGISLKSINENIKALGKHPSLQKLDLKLNIDKSFISNVSSLSKNLNSITTQLQQQSIANNNVNNGLKQTTQQIEEQTRATNEAIKAGNKWRLVRDQVNKAGMTTARYANGNQTQIVTKLPDGGIKDIVNTTDYDKERKAIEAIDRAHYNALKDNKAKIETMDKLHYLALQKNREMDWKNLQAANKQSEALDKAHYQALKVNNDLKAKNQKQTQSLINYAYSGKQNTNSASSGVAEAKALEVLNRQYDKVLSKLNETKNSGNQLTNSELAGINRRIEALNNLASRQKTVEKDRASLSSTQLRAETQVNNLLSGRYKEKVDSAQLTGLLSQLKSLDTQTANFKGKAKEITDQINRISAEAKNASPSVQGLGDTLKRTFSSMLMYAGIGSLFYGSVNALKSGIQHIYELDSAMTDLRKVTDETNATYTHFLSNANEIANSIGGVTIDVVKSTTEWARLGYTIQQAQSLAKQTLVYQNVGDIKSAEDASKSLISTIKGFGIEVDNEGKNVTKIVDIYNEVGNKFAISSAGIGEALRRSAASLSEAGNTIEESVALATAANSTIQDPARVGQMLKTVSMRLRGMSEDGEDLSGLIPSLEKKFNGLGLTLKKDENTFKSTYEIFQDLASVWGDLTDFQRADVLEGVAGKLQGNIAASLITNFSDAEKSLQTALNSTGSAARENEKYINSMAGRVALLKNATSEFWTKSFNVGVLKGIIDATTWFIKKLDNLGNVMVMVTAIFMTFKSKAIADTIVGLFNTVRALTMTKAALSASSTEALRAATSMTIFQRSLGVIGLAVSAFSILFTLLRSNSNVMDEQNQKIEEANRKYEDLGSTLQETENYYKENYAAINQNSEVKDKLFKLQNQLIDSFGLESKGLDLVNGRYDEQLDKLKNLNKQKLQNEIDDAKFRVSSAKEKKYDTSIKGAFGNWYNGREFNIKGMDNLDPEQYYKALLAMRDKIHAEDKSIFDAPMFAPKNANEWDIVLSAIQTKLEEIKPTIDDIGNTESKQKELLKLNTLEQFESQVKLNDKQKEFFDSINSVSITQPLEDYSKNIEDIVKLSGQLKDDGSNFVALINQVKEFEQFKGNPELLKMLDDFIKKSLDAMSSVVNLDTAMANINTSYKDNSDGVKELNQILSDLNEGNKLNSETVGDLIQNYPQLAKYAKKTADGWTIEKNAVTTLRDEKVKFFKNDLENEKKNAVSVVNASIQKMTAYGLQVKTVNNLAEAKQALLDIDDELNKPVAPSSLSDSGTNLFGSFMPKGFADVLSKDLLKSVDDYTNLTIKKTSEAALAQREQIKKNIEAIENLISTGEVYAKSLIDPTLGVTAEKSNEKLNNSYTDTVEILTELQKRMEAIDKLRDAEIRKRSRLRKDSKEYQDSLKKENDLLKEKIILGNEGIKDPSKLVATKVTTTTKTNDSSSSASSSTTGSGSSSIDNMLSNALGLQGKFTYKQVSGKFQGTYEEFVKGATSDCSQFVQEMFDEFLNINLPRTAAEQAKQGVAVAKADLQAGDLVFFNTTGKDNSHVGIYTGNGKFVQMGNSGLKEQDLNSKTWTEKYTYNGAKRVASSSSSTSTGKLTTKDGNTTVKTDSPTQKDMADAVEAQLKQNNETDDQIYQNNLLILESIKEGFDRKIQEQEDFIYSSKRTQEKLDPNSIEWRKENEKQVNAKGNIQGIQHEAKTTLQAEMKKLGIESNEWDDILKKLSSDWLDVQSEKYALLIENFNSQIDSTKQRISDLDNLIEQSKNRMSKFDIGSPEYNKELNIQIELTKKQNKENENLKKSLETLANSKKLDPATRKKFKEMLDDLNLKDYTSDIKDLNAELIASKSTPLTKEIDDLNHKLDVSKATLKGFKEGTEDYNVELKKQLTIIDELVIATKKLKDYAETQSKNEELSASVKEDYKKQVQELTMSLYDYADSLKSIREEYADNVIEKYKKMLQEQQKLRDAAYDKEKEAEDARHEARMSNLDDEMSKFEEAINAQTKSFDREVAAEDYTDQLAKLQKEKAELDSKFSSKLLDDSLEEKLARADLQKEIDAKQEEITKLQRDREITIRKEGLSDQLEDRKAAVDKEKKLDDDKNKLILKGIEEAKKKNDEYYDGLLNDEQYFYNMKQNLMSEDTVKIQSELDKIKIAYDAFFNELEKNSAGYAEKIKANLKYSIGLDKDYSNNFPINDKPNTSGGTGNVAEQPNNTTPVESMNRNAAWSEYLSNKQMAEQLLIDMKTLMKDSSAYKNKQMQFEKLNSTNEGYRTKYGFQDGSYAALSKITKYHSGGEVGVEGTNTKKWWENFEVPALLKKGEVVLDRPRDFFSEIIGNIKNNLSNTMAQVTSGIVGNRKNLDSQIAPVNNKYEINIDRVIGTEKDAKLVATTINDVLTLKQKQGR